MSNDKYELTNESIMIGNTKLYRIKALKDINFKYGYIVKAGCLGGYVESWRNLSRDGDSWIANNACVYGNAFVTDNAAVYGNAKVHGDAYVYGNAQVYGNVKVYGNAKVHGDAYVYGNAKVHGDAYVYGNAQVYGNAFVYGNAIIANNAHVFRNAKVYGDAYVYGNAQVYGNAKVYGESSVYDRAKVHGKSEVYGIAHIGSNMTICDGNIDSNDNIVYLEIDGTPKTFHVSRDNTIVVSYREINYFRESVRRAYDESIAKAYLMMCDLAELKLSDKLK